VDLTLERCPGLEEVGPEEVHNWRKCTTGGSAQLEEVHNWRKCTTGGSAQLEGVQEQRECMSRGSVQAEEGQSSWRKVWSWTWKCPKTLVDLTEEAEQEQEQN